MPGRWGTALVGASLAACAFGAVMVFPAALGEGPRTLAPSEHAPPLCSGVPCEPGPDGFVAQVDARLAARMPRLDRFDRRFLAHTIVAEAEAARIDPLLVLALIEVESSFDPVARSGRGALGLMQLRDTTMRREVERSGLPFDDPRDPVANVQAGVRYLRRLLDAFGQEETALMAYNAGPNRILGYVREGAIPDRFRIYPRRVRAELRRLRRSVGAPSLMVAAAAAQRAGQ